MTLGSGRALLQDPLVERTSEESGTSKGSVRRKSAFVWTAILVAMYFGPNRVGGEPTARLVQPNGFGPAWSLDGNSLLCSHLGMITNDSEAQIWLVPLDGSPPDSLTHDPQGAFFPQWLLDGERIAYFRSFECVIVNPGGGESKVWPAPNLIDDPGIAITADGRLLYTRALGAGDYETWALDPETGASSFVFAEAGAVISPDAGFIAYTNERDTLLVAPLGPGPAVRLGRGFFPSWTPDSRFVVYTGIDSGGTPDLYLANREGTFQQQLTDDPEFEGYPRVSPSGTSVAYSREVSRSLPPELWVLEFEIPPWSIESRSWSEIKSLYRE